MKRTDHIFTRGDMYRLIPHAMKQTLPGDRTTVNIKGMMESDIIAALRCPAVITHYCFYVPHRLVWSGFEQFISDADSVAVIPSVNYSTSPFPELGEATNSPWNSLYRRAFKLVYNEFFGDLDFGTHAWYTDPTLDTAQNTVLPLKAVNQLLGAVALDIDEPADNYTVAASTIELTEFNRRLKQNRRQNNQRIGGEKYVDALRRFGVDMREELAGRPELIGRSSEVVYPQEVFNTSDINTGSRVGRYRVAIDFKSKRFFSMEHGTIIAMSCVRPFIARGVPLFEKSVLDRASYLETHAKEYREWPMENFGTSTAGEPDPLVPASKVFDLGDMITMNGATGVFGYAATTTMANLIYPTVLGTPKVEVATSVVTEIVR